VLLSVDGLQRDDTNRIKPIQALPRIYRRSGMNARVLDANSEMESPGGWLIARIRASRRGLASAANYAPRVDTRVLVITRVT